MPGDLPFSIFFFLILFKLFSGAPWKEILQNIDSFEEL